MTHCVVRDCTWYKNKPFVKFFNFPMDEDRKKSWLDVAKRQFLCPKYAADGLCQFHFHENDLIIYNNKKIKPRLKQKCDIKPRYFHWNFDYGTQARFDDMENLGNLSYYPTADYDNKNQVNH